jgi:hypothetical protein
MIVIGFLSHDQSTIGKTFSKVLPFVHDGGPPGTIGKSPTRSVGALSGGTGMV